MPLYRWEGTALIIDLQVQPGARRDEIVGLHGDRLKLRITAPPLDGRANQQLIEFLASVFGVPRAQVNLMHGQTGRAKTVRIESPRTLPAQISPASQSH